VIANSNDYFANHYWALKKVMIISLFVTGPPKNLTISSLFFPDKTNC
jgi:hypothetical protein